MWARREMKDCENSQAPTWMLVLPLTEMEHQRKTRFHGHSGRKQWREVSVAGPG